MKLARTRLSTRKTGAMSYLQSPECLETLRRGSATLTGRMLDLDWRLDGGASTSVSAASRSPREQRPRRLGGGGGEPVRAGAPPDDLARWRLTGRESRAPPPQVGASSRQGCIMSPASSPRRRRGRAAPFVSHPPQAGARQRRAPRRDSGVLAGKNLSEDDGRRQQRRGPLSPCVFPCTADAAERSS